jgi:hypothetical protein
MEDRSIIRDIIADTRDGEDEPRRIEIVVTIDVTNEDRVRRIGAERLSEAGHAGRIEDIQSKHLSELAWRTLLAERPEGQSLEDMGIRIVGTTLVEDGPDLWDSASTDQDGFWFRHMPETDVDGLFSEEKDLLKIVREKDGFWLGEDGLPGQSRYTTLAAAKSAGDRIWDRADAEQAGLVLKDAGLDPTKWTFHRGASIRFVRSDGASVEADADGFDDKQRWHAFLCRSHGTDAINEDPVDDVATALALLPPLN